jgi:hypothetical protein
MNDELEARVKNRIKIVNAGIAVPVERQLGSGVVVNAGADSLSEDQPPISMSAILDDTHEIERELSRFIRPDTEYSKRENFADYEDV